MDKPTCGHLSLPSTSVTGEPDFTSARIESGGVRNELGILPGGFSDDLLNRGQGRGLLSAWCETNLEIRGRAQLRLAGHAKDIDSLNTNTALLELLNQSINGGLLLCVLSHHEDGRGSILPLAGGVLGKARPGIQ